MTLSLQDSKTPTLFIIVTYLFYMFEVEIKFALRMTLVSGELLFEEEEIQLGWRLFG